VNPAAAGGRVGRTWPRLRSRLAATGLRAPETWTEAPGHATAIARSLVAQGEDLVVAVGGDGTICEVVQGLYESGRGALGILPLGTGNDAARTLGVPLRLEDAAGAVSDGPRRRVDLMRLGDRVVLNAIGIGLLGSINVNAASIKVVRGIAAYLVAATGTLLSYHPIPIQLTNGSFRYEGGMTILAVHNGPSTGGGFRLTPSALPDDGILDACLVGPVGVPGRLSRLVAALQGRLGSRPGSHELRFTRLDIRTDVPLPAHLDGNPYAIEAPGVAIEVLPAALTVCALAPRARQA
jgi:diacylglycerol kinase (ATP)